MKKLFALILALSLILSLAACGSTAEPAETTTAPTTEAPTEAEVEVPLMYTHAEDKGDFIVTWNLTLYSNGYFVIEEISGLSGNTTMHTGTTWTDNGDGTITTGPWDDSSGDKSDFFKPNGECTWTVNGDGTVTPPAVEEENEGGVKPGKYTYSEDRGDFTIEWTIQLNGNGSFVLSEVHGLSGNVTEHTGTAWTDNGNGTVTTGEWDDSSVDKSEFFKPNGECTWVINEDGTCAPAEEGSEETAGGINPGKYTYSENRGDFTIEWSVMLNGNGSFTLEEVHGLSGELTTHTGAAWTDNGDGTVTTGAWDDPSVDKSEFFAEDGTCTWTINADGTATPVA